MLNRDRRRTALTWSKLLVPAMGTLGGLVLLRMLGPEVLNQERLARWLEPLGPWAAVVYLALLVIRPFTLISGQVFTAVGGLVFGVKKAFVLAMLGDFLASVVVFLLARRYARRLMKRLAKERYPALTRAARRHDFKFALLVTINPLLPTDLANAAAASAGARLWPTVFGILLGTAPGVFLMAQFGSALGQGKDVLAAVSVAGVVLTLVLGVRLGRQVRREMDAEHPPRVPERGSTPARAQAGRIAEEPGSP